MPTAKRSLAFSLGEANTHKLDILDSTWKEYRHVVNYFLKRLERGEDITEDMLKRFHSPLSYRYLQCAKRQALFIRKTWEKRWAGRIEKAKEGKASMPRSPRLRNPSLVLDQRFIALEKASNSFDYWARISTIEKGKPVLAPLKSYEYASEYFSDWKLVKGGRMVKRGGTWMLVLTFEKDIERKETDRAIGVDIGFRKLLVTSDGTVYGSGIRELIGKASRKKKGSRAEKASRQHIKTEINRAVKHIPSDASIGVEDLRYLKHGKKKVWNKKVNNKFSYWYYAQVLKRIKELSEVRGVHCRRVDPRGSSRECPICGHVNEKNRDGEVFSCLACGFTHDADYVGSLNILSRFSGEPIVPQAIKPKLVFVS